MNEESSVSEMVNSLPWRSRRFPISVPVPEPVQEFCNDLARQRVENDRKIRGKHWVHKPADDGLRNHAQALVAEWAVAKLIDAPWQPDAKRRDPNDLWWGLRELPMHENPHMVHVRSGRPSRYQTKPYLRVFAGDKPGPYFAVWFPDTEPNVLGWMDRDEVWRVGTTRPFRDGEAKRRDYRMVIGAELDQRICRLWP